MLQFNAVVHSFIHSSEYINWSVKEREARGRVFVHAPLIHTLNSLDTVATTTTTTSINNSYNLGLFVSHLPQQEKNDNYNYNYHINFHHFTNEHHTNGISSRVLYSSSLHLCIISLCLHSRQYLRTTINNAINENITHEFEMHR